MQKITALAMVIAAVMTGTVFAKDPATLIKECEKNNAQSCGFSGSHYLWGTGGFKQDSALALKYFVMGCDGKDGQSCHGVGSIYSDPNYTGRDMAKALAGFKKACDLGIDYSCGAVEALSKKSK